MAGINTNITEEPGNPKETIMVVLKGAPGKRRAHRVDKRKYCEKSGHFRVACEVAAHEGIPPVVFLTGCEPAVFWIIGVWIQTGNLNIDTLKNEDDGTLLIGQIGKLWSLARYLLCFELCNDIMAHVSVWWEVGDWEFTWSCFAHFPIRSMIWVFFVEFFAGKAHQFSDQQLDYMPPSFQRDVLRCASHALRKTEIPDSSCERFQLPLPDQR